MSYMVLPAPAGACIVVAAEPGHTPVEREIVAVILDVNDRRVCLAIPADGGFPYPVGPGKGSIKWHNTTAGRDPG